MNAPKHFYLLIIALLFGAGCANIVPPSGGEQDRIPPKLVSVIPADSQLNVRTAKIRLNFDEYITVNDVSSQVIISPILPVAPVVTSLNKRVTVTFPDSLLEDNTTYHITFGTAIRDNHENNIYKSSGYIFSTGPYFDSLSLGGKVINSMTGLPDSAVTIMLYSAADGDSAIMKKKPLYAAHVNGDGTFLLQGLPKRTFAIYGLRDNNNNLLFDDRNEWVSFLNEPVVPAQDSFNNILLRTFPQQGLDTTRASPTTAGTDNSRRKKMSDRAGASESVVRGQGYAVLADTTDQARRTHDITKPLSIAFGILPVTVDEERIFLSADSLGMTVEKPFKLETDTVTRQWKLTTTWDEDKVYTLRLQKGFAKDSTGNDLLPGRYSFRTRRDEDYAKLEVRLPAKYLGKRFLFMVSNDVDTIYENAVSELNVRLLRIPPGNYTMRIIDDANENGEWDTGDLFADKQPEIVIPYDRTILLKAGWENQVDFEIVPEPNQKSRKISPPVIQK